MHSIVTYVAKALWVPPVCSQVCFFRKACWSFDSHLGHDVRYTLVGKQRTTFRWHRGESLSCNFSAVLIDHGWVETLAECPSYPKPNIVERSCP